MPLIGLALMHLLFGDGWLWLAWIPVLLCFLAITEFVHRKRTAAIAARAAKAGRHIWRASIPTGSLGVLTRVPTLVRIARDLVPLDAEIAGQALILSPPRRYRRLGLASGSIPAADVRHIDHYPLGHVRPDGSISSSPVTAVRLTLRAAHAFDLIFDFGADNFVSALGHLAPQLHGRDHDVRGSGSPGR